MSQLLNKKIDEVIRGYIKTVSEKYSLDMDELYSLWTGSEVCKKKEGLACVNMEDCSPERLLKSSKAELTSLCKSKGLKCTGTKEVLVNRLLGKDEDAVVKKKSKETEKKVEKKKETKKVEKKEHPVLEKIKANIPVFPIRRNKFGNYAHPETGLVFDLSSNNVIGKQESDGTVSELDDDSIELCKKYKFAYDVPTNLDKGDLSNVKVDELNEDELIGEGDDEELEEDGDDEEEDVEEIEEDE
jgi:hypothetical protein